MASNLTTNTSLCDYPWTGPIYLYGLALLLLSALMLNTLCFATFRTKALRRHAFSCLMSALAVVDSLALLSYVPGPWLNLVYETLTRDNPHVFTSDITCRAVTYCMHVARFLAAWTVVALATERIRVSRNPYTSLPGPATALKALAGVTVCGLALTAYIPVFWSGPTCTPRLWVLPLVDLGLTLALPSLTALTLAILLNHNLQSNVWHLRPRKSSPALDQRLALQRRAVLLVALLAGSQGILALPLLGSQVALVWRETCALLATRDTAQLAYLTTHALKFVYCACCGLKLITPPG